MTNHGTIVTVNGAAYKVVGVGPASRDQKFWGRRQYVLRKLKTQELFVTYAKMVTHNSRLLPYKEN